MEPIAPDRIWHWIAPDGGSLLASLAAHAPAGAVGFADLLRLGAVFHNRRRIREDISLSAGDYLRVHLFPRRYPLPAGSARSAILTATDDYFIVDKPAGVPVHPSLDNAEENVVAWLERETASRLYVTQRLDVPTSGLMVIARTPAFQRRFNRWLAERQVEKVYRALTARPLSPGPMVHYQKPDPRAPKQVRRDVTPGWLRCESEILDCRAGSDTYEVDIRLKSGRTHQIRCQLADYGAPILGDGLYRGLPGQTVRIALQSYRLAFAGQTWEVPRPERWSAAHFPLSEAAP